MQQVMQTSGIAHSVAVENIPGAAGTIGLARFISAERGTNNAMMVSGLIMLGAIVTHRSPVTLRDVTPVARLIGEYEAIAVPTASPFRTLQDLIDAFKQHPESISWGGGSAGGTDQILAGLIADAVGVSPRRVNYIAFSGGGEALSAVLGNQVSVGINGLAEFEGQVEAGALRLLGISSAARLAGVDVPTLREQGVDVELENWRSVVAPPHIRADDFQQLSTAIDTMVRSEAWRLALERYRWLDRYLTGREFERFVLNEEARVQAILSQLGTGDGATSSSPATGPYPLLVLAGLALTGVAALTRSVRTAPDLATKNDRRGWRPVTLMAIGIALDLVLLQPAGFVIASATLFWFTARAFDGRHPFRDLVFAFGVSVGCYLLFVRALELSLPAGLLAGWL